MKVTNPDDWTGAVEAQRREGRVFLVLVVVVVLLALPLALWFADWLARAVLGLA